MSRCERSMEDLPEELHRAILARLRDPRDLNAAIAAAPAFAKAARAQTLWKGRALSGPS